MSDTRRRRKSHQSGGSDDMSDSYEEVNTTKETQSSEYNEDHHDSEYDTAGSESDTESQDKVQRESGDGQEEEKPQKKLDDDEDRRNPQYIPKRGTFYEHDDRTADEINEEVVEEKPEREVKDKKVWKDKEDRWDHDRYNDEEQAPKSHAELIAVYGYDIRNEEGPPRARRRRRYGRGPNKYTRNWEDEDAYGKVAGSNVPPKPAFKKSNRTSEEFPVLNQKKNETVEKTEEKPVFTSAWYSNKTKQLPNKTPNFPALQQSESQKAKPKQFGNSPVNETRTSNDRNNAWKKETKNTSYIQNVNETSSKETDKIVLVKSSTREIKKPQQPQEFASSMIASKGRGRGFKANTNNNVVGSRTIEQKPKSQRPGGSMSIDNRRSNVEHEQVINEYKHANISSTEGSSYIHAARQNKQFYNQPSSQQHSGVVPPRMQQPPPQQQQQQAPPPPPQQQPPQSTQPPPQQQDITASRPKRYSSLRQRPNLPEGPPNPAQPNYPPAPPQHTYYPPPPPQAGSSRAVLESPGYAPSPYEQQAPVPAPGQPVMQIPPPGAQPAPGYVPHTHAPPPFLVPPPQFIASQTAPPNIINYVPGPNGHIFQPNYQSYSPAGVPVNLEPGPPPQEVPLYQPQGCTYYNAAQQQQQQPQPVPLRRPKAAIPILPPPENQNNRGRNRQSQSQLDQQQQEQLLQQQQQQEQLVRQQLQQRQQQLIQQQQQELQQQQEKLKQQQQQQQHQHQQQQHQPQQPEIIQYSQNDSQNIPQLSDQTTNDSRSNVIIMTDPNVNLEEKLRNVTLNETTNPNNEDQTLEVTEVEVSTRKKELVSTGIVESDHVEEKLGISAAQTIETDKTSISTGEKSELDCVVQDSTVINKAAA